MGSSILGILHDHCEQDGLVPEHLDETELEEA
jgi:hypothetical protein